ncbi:MAG: glycosyltransferase family 2 protein [Clostridium sp.]|nr:glycosyltransferase family 2 protein [Clostridium sp.]
MKILIPMVGSELKNNVTGSPYCTALYEIGRKTILQHIVEPLAKLDGAEFVFILDKKSVEKYRLDSVIKLLLPNAAIVVAQGKTKGSACSCLLGMDYLEPKEPLIIVGGDQLITADLRDAVDTFARNDWDGGVITFSDIHPRWSYVMLDNNGFVIEAAEKHPISSNATTGFYYFKHTKDFVESAFKMIRKKAEVDGNFFVCPVYNEMVLARKTIGTYRIEKEQYYNFNHFKGIELYEEYYRKGRLG